MVANVVVPTAQYARFAAHYRVPARLLRSEGPESKGAVEALVRIAKSDLVVPAGDCGGDLAAANDAARAWCAEVNARIHTEIQAVPAARLAEEVRGCCGRCRRRPAVVRIAAPTGRR